MTPQKLHNQKEECMLLDLKTLGPERYGHHFAHETFIFFKESLYIMIRISMEFVPKGPIDNRSALLFLMAWWRTGIKQLSEPMVSVVHWCIYMSCIECQTKLLWLFIHYVQINVLCAWNHLHTRCQGISSHGIDLVIPEYSSYRPRKIDAKIHGATLC